MASPSKVIRFPVVEYLTGLPRSSIYAAIKAGDFPKPFKLSQDGRSVGFLERDVLSWIDRRAGGRAA
jgi:prophage regulatory protein